MVWLSVAGILLLSAFVITLGAAGNRPGAPLWLAVLLLTLVHMLSLFGLR